MKHSDVEGGRQRSSRDDPPSQLTKRIGQLAKKLAGKLSGNGKTEKAGNGAKGAKNLSSMFSEHTWSIERLATQFPDSGVSAIKPEQSTGLSNEVATRLLNVTGPNRLPAPKEISDLRLFLNQFTSMFWILLGIVAALNLADYLFATESDPSSLYVPIIIYTMIVVMCYISFYQEREARRVVRGFQNLLPSQCVVIRDAAETTIDAESLVVGDVVRVRSGMRLPADVRMILCTQLRLETSSITGESEPVEFQAEAVAEGVNVFESRNVAFNGAYCVDGDGVGVVIRRGADTVIGHIAALTTEQEAKESHLEWEIKHFVKFLTAITVAIGLLAFAVGSFNAHWHHAAILLATSFSVCVLGMIPEGMPATVTSCLTLVARRMARRNVYLKKLDIVEALGCASIIASDKTGTLTKNMMTVTDVWYCDEYITDLPDYIDYGNNHSNNIEHPLQEHRGRKGSTYVRTRTINVRTISRVSSPLSELLTAMTVCNTAKFDESSPKARRKAGLVLPTEQIQMTKSTRRRKMIEEIQGKRAIGAPSEVALIKYAEQLINVHEFRKRHDVVFEIPFNSKRKFHAVIARMGESSTLGQNQYLLLMKGAPEILIQRCSTIFTEDNGEQVPLSAERTAEFERAYTTYGENGRRVIGFAQRSFTAPSDLKFDVEQENFPLQDLAFIGICAIMDPPRDETQGAIRECKEAGIKVFMVTGDHHITATAIAKQLKLIGDEAPGVGRDWEVIRGEQISRLTTADWDRLVARRSLVFARTTPEQKLQIVEECQRRNQIIAMTGDGVNDAPALKRADIGVGMGSGSDVAKQAADIVLTDDNFSSIVGAVEEGRVLFDNIKKMMTYILSHAFPQVWGIMISYCFGMPHGITTMVILTIDLGTEIPPGIAMCKEPLEGDVMKRPPRRADQNLVSKAMLFYCYGYMGHLRVLTSFFAYMAVFWGYGITLSDLWMSTHRHHFTPESAGGQMLFAGGRNFTVGEQLYINRQAVSAWQVGVVFGQCFHVFSCRTLRQSMFTQGFLSNKYIIYSIIIELVMLLTFVYCPGVNTFLGGAPCPWYCWAIVAGFGVLIHLINEVRKYFIRNWPMHPAVRWFKF